jgi:molybdenum cofactor synthesis domain-containing protein
MNLPGKFDVLIITLSDRASKGEYEDLSGPRVREIIEEFFPSAGMKYTVTLILIPDDSEALKNLIQKACEEYNIIITTGGTGIGPRDITVDVVTPFLTKQIPGIMEFIRVKYGSLYPGALLSRGVAGIAGKALIYTLPGSVKAVEEYMCEIVKTLKHTIYMQHGVDKHA